MTKNIITKFNPKFHNDNFDAEENFCNQLKEVIVSNFAEEYYEYLEYKLDYLKTRCESKYAEVLLLRFQKERNHPDEEVYNDYDNPCYEYCEYLEELINDVELEMKQLEDDCDKKDKEMRELKVA